MVKSNYLMKGITTMLAKIKNIKWGYVLIAAILGAVGTCFLLFNNSLTTLTVTIGVILAVFGAGVGVIAMAGTKRGLAFALKIGLAVISLASGISVAIFNNDAANVLIAVFCLLLIVDGSFKLHTSAMAKRYSVFGWWIIMAVALLLIASAFLLTKLSPEITVATTHLGVMMIADAILNLFSTFWIAKYETAQRAELYYEVHRDIEGKE